MILVYYTVRGSALEMEPCHYVDIFVVLAKCIIQTSEHLSRPIGQFPSVLSHDPCLMTLTNHQRVQSTALNGISRRWRLSRPITSSNNTTGQHHPRPTWITTATILPPVNFKLSLTFQLSLMYRSHTSFCPTGSQYSGDRAVR